MLAHRVAGPSESVNSSPSAFRRTAPYARRLEIGNPACSRPGPAVRVVLQCVEVAQRRGRPRSASPLRSPGWFVDDRRVPRRRGSTARPLRGPSWRRSCDLRSARQPFSVRASSASGDGKVWMSEPSFSRSAVVIAYPVRSPTCSRRLRDAPPQRAGDSRRSLRTRRQAPRASGSRRLAGEDLDERSAVSCEDFHTSAATAPASRPRRTLPGCRPAPWPGCTTAAGLCGESDPSAGPLRGDGPPRARAAADHEHVKEESADQRTLPLTT
jgi:hypothetical protein